MARVAPALAAPASAAQLPITLKARQEVDKPISLVPYSKFYGELDSDPDKHFSEFLLQCNTNNARIDVHWHSIFPTILKGHAKLWYYRQPLGPFSNWDTLRDAFVAHFRLIGYDDRLTKQLADITMAPGRVVYCAVTDPAPSQRHDKIGIITARHRDEPCRYHDGGGKWRNIIVTRGRLR